MVENVYENLYKRCKLHLGAASIHLKMIWYQWGKKARKPFRWSVQRESEWFSCISLPPPIPPRNYLGNCYLQIEH